MIKSILTILKSPTLITWISFLIRSLGLLIVLPQIIRNFTSAETAVWFLFSSIIAVQSLIGFGFNPSFARVIAYAYSGASIDEIVSISSRDIKGSKNLEDDFSRKVRTANWNSLNQIDLCMSRVFTTLGIISFLVLSTIGTIIVRRSINGLGNSLEGWVSWIVLSATLSISFLGLRYTSFFQGLNKIYEWKAIETAMGICSIVTSGIVLFLGGRLLATVIAIQIWTIASIFLFHWKKKALLDGELYKYQVKNFEPRLFTVVWRSAWKSGLTSIMTYGLIQFTGLIQAQIGNASSTANYNFTLRIFSVFSQIVQVPFTTKIPILNQLYSSGEREKLISTIKRGMQYTLWSAFVIYLVGGIALKTALPFLNSKTIVFDKTLWVLFGLNLIFERHGGILHQIRNLTNQPMEHVGMLGYFVCFTVSSAIFSKVLGVYAFPAAMLTTQLIFAVWFNSYIAYPVIRISPFKFESKVSFPVLFAAAIVTGMFLIT